MFKKAFISIVAVIVLSCSVSLAASQKNSNAVTTGSYSATISWVTDKPCTSQIEYGEKSSYASRTSENINLVIYHKVAIYNLNPSTLYQYRVKSKDAYGNEAVSGNFSFVTLKDPAKDQPPQISDVEAGEIVAAGLQADNPAPAQKQASEPNASSKDSSKANQLVKNEAPIEKALIDKGGILLKKGTLQIEPSITYLYTSANRITVSGYTVLPVLVIGEISTQKVKRDIVVDCLTGRYGIRNDLQLEVSVPYRFQYERASVEAPALETIRRASGIGDISSGLFYQCAYESGPMPDLIAGISVKSRTGEEPYNNDIGLGTGHWGIKGSLVAVKSSDPATLFASLGYTYNVERKGIENYGTIKPGDSYDYSLGVAFALNYQLALSCQLQQSITPRMRLNHASVIGSYTNVVALKYGLTWAISKDFSCDISASHGLTTDSPDFVFTASFPYTF